MPIVSSRYVLGHAQANGKRYVEEFHTDSAGAVHRIEYGPMADGTDYQAIMAARAAHLAVQLADREAEELWADGVWRALQHQTGPELAARFREAYRRATDQRAGRLAWWIIERINLGNITDAQVRAAFGLTTQQYTALKTRMTTLHDQYAALMSARGE